MRTSRAALALIAVLSLAACDPSAFGQAPDRVSVSVAGRSLTVAGPPGFCVDPRSTNVSATGAFVMVSDCALVSGRPPEGDGGLIGAVMTASISAADAGDGAQTMADVQRLAGTPQGRAMLSRSGQSDRVRILDTRVRGNVVYMFIEDRGPQPVEGVDRQFWRAFLDVQGQMTVLSVLGFEGAGVTPTASLGYIRSFADAIARANPD